MPSAASEQLYQQISELSAEAVKLSRKGDFERVDGILVERLTLLKTLAESIAGVDQESKAYQVYLEFLAKTKESDDKELHFLQKERSRLMIENSEQKKRKKAVSVYHNVSLDSR